MKTFRTITAALLISLSVAGIYARPLGNVENDRYHIHLYDTDGNKFKTISNINGEVKGYSSDFFITQKDGWIYLYNNDGKMYKTLPVNMIGEVTGVQGDTFTTKKGNKTSMYTSQGKLVYSIEHNETGNKIRI